MARTGQRLRLATGISGKIANGAAPAMAAPAVAANTARKPAHEPSADQRPSPGRPAAGPGASAGPATRSGTGTRADTSAKAETRARPRAGAREMPLLAVLSAAVLGYAWTQRNEGLLTAETGLGYWLGIVGASMMLALLLYPLRKRLPVLRHLGQIRSWFRWHMILGIVGPVLVILHSNFKLASLNGRVAMITMLIVAGSGIIGRFLYAGIHRGLYGRRTSARECMNALGQLKEELRIPEQIRTEIRAELEAHEAGRLGERISLWRALRNSLSRPFAQRALRQRILARVAEARGGDAFSGSAAQTRRARAEFSRALKAYLDELARAESFAIYERLFALWHLLHLPLFVLLVLAAVVHVLAVHLY